MKYEGKIYGKVGGKYIELEETENRELTIKTAKEIFEAAQWDMIRGVRYLDEKECIALIEKLRGEYE